MTKKSKIWTSEDPDHVYTTIPVNAIVDDADVKTFPQGAVLPERHVQLYRRRKRTLKMMIFMTIVRFYILGVVVTVLFHGCHHAMRYHNASEQASSSEIQSDAWHHHDHHHGYEHDHDHKDNWWHNHHHDHGSYGHDHLYGPDHHWHEGEGEGSHGFWHDHPHAHEAHMHSPDMETLLSLKNLDKSALKPVYPDSTLMPPKPDDPIPPPPPPIPEPPQGHSHSHDHPPGPHGPHSHSHDHPPGPHGSHSHSHDHPHGSHSHSHDHPHGSHSHSHDHPPGPHSHDHPPGPPGPHSHSHDHPPGPPGPHSHSHDHPPGPHGSHSHSHDHPPGPHGPHFHPHDELPAWDKVLQKPTPPLYAPVESHFKAICSGISSTTNTQVEEKVKQNINDYDVVLGELEMWPMEPKSLYIPGYGTNDVEKDADNNLMSKGWILSSNDGSVLNGLVKLEDDNHFSIEIELMRD